MAESIGALFSDVSKRFSQKCALKGRVRGKFEETSYSSLFELVRDFGSGLISLGIMPSDKVFVLSDNRKEWLVSDLAILSIGAVNVSRGSDSTPPEIEYILNHSGAKLAIIENHSVLEKTASSGYDLSELEAIIILDEKDGVAGQENTYTFSQIIDQGREHIKGGDQSFETRLNAVQKGDLATIVYTSGTTGLPKGVLLTHQNILSNIEATLQSVKIQSDDRLLSILPSWHMFERTVEYIILGQGATIIYTNPKTLRRDMISEKPTYLVGVPRIWEVIYEGASKRFKSGNAFARNLVALLLRLGKSRLLTKRTVRNEEIRFAEEGALPLLLKRWKAHLNAFLLLPSHWIAERMVFSRVRSATGGSLRAAISGGGSLPVYIDDFFEMVGIMLLNGYGLTETSPILTVRTVDHNVRGTVGRPVVHTELKIVDEKGNDVAGGNQGMIWARGPQIMKGYFQNEEASRKVMKEGGWFDTGDLGRITVTGDLVITGRAKDTIVLSGGENVEPEPIETVLRESQYIENVMVVGQDRKFLAALVCPAFHALSDHLGQKEIAREELLGDSSVHELIRKEIASRINEANGFKVFERVNQFTLVSEEWSRDNGLLTPTLKLKRNIINERYRDLIQGLYG